MTIYCAGATTFMNSPGWMALRSGKVWELSGYGRR